MNDNIQVIFSINIFSYTIIDSNSISSELQCSHTLFDSIIDSGLIDVRELILYKR